MTWFDEARLDDESALGTMDMRLRHLAESGSRVRREVGDAAEAADSAVERARELDRPRAVVAAGPDSRLLRAVRGLTLLGRGPQPREGESAADLVALPSTDMSVSKTHAQLQLSDDGSLVVMDRGSTNGSVLIRQGVPRHLSAGRPVTLLDGDVLHLGDRVLEISGER